MFPTPLTTRLVYTAFGFGATVFGLDLVSHLLAEPLTPGIGLLYLFYFWAAFGAYKGQAIWAGVLTLFAVAAVGLSVAIWSTFLSDPALVGSVRLGLASILGAAGVAVLPRFAGTMWALGRMDRLPVEEREMSIHRAPDPAEPQVSPWVALGVVVAAVGAVVAFGASPLAEYALDHQFTAVLGALTLLLWIGSAAWSYGDARRRGVEPLPIALLVLLGGPFFGPWAWTAERKKLARV